MILTGWWGEFNETMSVLRSASACLYQGLSNVSQHSDYYPHLSTRHTHQALVKTTVASTEPRIALDHRTGPVSSRGSPAHPALLLGSAPPESSLPRILGFE